MTPTGPLPGSNSAAFFSPNEAQADVHCLCVMPR